MWLALTFVAECQDAERLADAFLALGAVSVDMADAQAGSADEVSVYAERHCDLGAHWPLARFQVLLSPASNPEVMMREACNAVMMSAHPSFQVITVEDQDWVRVTQSQFSPVRISERLWIVPSWHDPPDSSAFNLRLDPGLAFGTGSHPTTWQCLRWLDANLKHGQSVLDYGCGSGILAIAASKLGAGPVVATDIDPQALRTTHDNAITNAVQVDCLLPEDLPNRGGYDIVLANILANPLRALAPLLVAYVRPEGHLVLAGILDRQVREVIDAFASWLELIPFEPREGWTALAGKLPATSH